MKEHWEHFEDGADIGVRGFGASKAGAFEQAALALMAVITEPGRVAASKTVMNAWPDKGINYCMHPANVDCLTAAHIDCCVLANNHVLDWGREGLEETLRVLRLRTLPVKPYLKVEHVQHNAPDAFFHDLAAHCDGSADFVDGVVFGPRQQVINRACFVDAAPEFLAFLLREIGILPIWICPVRGPAPDARFTLYPLEPGSLYVNFGFWDVVESTHAYETGHFNRLVEREVMRLGGIKSLYSDCFFTPEEFAQAYAMERYDALKARYDPAGRMLGLYQKCVLRA